MGQQQNKNDGKEPQEGKHHIHEPLKDRSSAKFQKCSPMFQSPKATGEGTAGTPGRPI